MEEEKKAPRLKTVGLGFETWKALKLYAVGNGLTLTESVDELLKLKDEVQRTKKGAGSKNRQ